MNIAEILKNCPTGMKLYSSVYGEVEFVCVKNNYSSIYPISCRKKNGYEKSFTNDGRIYFDYPEAECVLFPSKDQRDWSKFGVTDQATDQKPKPQFKPFDKVLVRDDDDALWRCDLFESIDEKDGTYNCIGSYRKQCIPYEGNEHLLGTTNKQQ